MNAINPITPRTSRVVILQGDDEARLTELRSKAQAAIGSDDFEVRAAEADTFATEAEKRGVTVVLRALGRKTWKKLISDNPPREGNDADKELGANSDAFEEAIVPASIASPTFESDEQRNAFLDSLSTAQFGDLAIKAWALNMGSGADPKARLSSEPVRS